MKETILQRMIDSCRKNTVEAKLIAKNIEETYGTTMFVNSGKVHNGANKKETVYIVTFYTKMMKTVTLFVSRSCYEELELNDKGILVYRGRKLLSFKGTNGNKIVQSKEKGMEFIGMNKKL